MYTPAITRCIKIKLRERKQKTRLRSGEQKNFERNEWTKEEKEVEKVNKKCIQLAFARARAPPTTSVTTAKVNKWSISFLICIYKLYQQPISFQAKWSEDNDARKENQNEMIRNHLFMPKMKTKKQNRTKRKRTRRLATHLLPLQIIVSVSETEMRWSNEMREKRERRRKNWITIKRAAAIKNGRNKKNRLVYCTRFDLFRGFGDCRLRDRDLSRIRLVTHK